MVVGRSCSVEPGDGSRQSGALRLRGVRRQSPFKRHDDPSRVSRLALVNRRSPESSKEFPRTVRLLLLDDFLGDQLQALLLSVWQRRKRLGRYGQEGQSHIQPSTLGARIGWIGGVGKNPRGHQF